MINYRVQNLENLVEELRKEGVIIVDTIETFEYGKFVHILDPEGNKIESPRAHSPLLAAESASIKNLP
jgi:predicted enzyme related to lactoylglutathione lyase